jgi:hypothetical protein
MNAGILLISCGPQHDALAARCINSIMRVSALPIHLHRRADLRGFASREEKLKMCELTPFQHTLYLDCDTLVLKDPVFILRDFAESGNAMEMAIDPASPDAGRMVAHPFYQQKLHVDTFKELQKLPKNSPHFNSGVVLFNNRRAVGCFTIWRNIWTYGPKEEDEPALMLAMAHKEWGVVGKYIHRLDPRWNFLCNPEKKDDVIAEGIRKAGILHLCGLNKAKNYNRITQLLLSRTSSRTSAPKGAPSQSP